MLKGWVLVLLIVATRAVYPQDFEWISNAQYDSNIPTPKSVLGYEIGEYLTDHLQMVEYIKQLAGATDRVRIFKFGQSVERRDMYLVVVSSSENMARLEEIRSTVSRLTDPTTTSSREAARIAGETPAIGWMNHATDGNETAAFESGIQLSYQLAAGTDRSIPLPRSRLP